MKLLPIDHRILAAFGRQPRLSRRTLESILPDIPPATLQTRLGALVSSLYLAGRKCGCEGMYGLLPKGKLAKES